MEFLRFIFSSVWVWLGFLILTGLVIDGLREMIKACKRERTVEFERIGSCVKLKVGGASKNDVYTAVIAAGYGLPVEQLDWKEDGEE